MRRLWFVLLCSLVYTTGVVTFGSPGHARLLAAVSDGQQYLLPSADATFNPQPVFSNSKQAGSCGCSSPTYSTSHASFSFSSTAAPVHGDADPQGITDGEDELLARLEELCKLIEAFKLIPPGKKDDAKCAARRLRSGRTFLRLLLAHKVVSYNQPTNQPTLSPRSPANTTLLP